MQIVFIFLFSIFLFTGCSSTTQQESVKPQKTKEKPVENSFQEAEELEDEFEEFAEFDEFEEETSVERGSDPFEGYNRAMTTFNDKFYIYVVDPVARGYKWVLPKGARKSIGNFFHNVLYPVRLVNNLLQGKMKNSAEETGRFMINSTVGILGLFDPAKSYFGLEPHEEDFGQTLGFYGVGAGPHIVLPFLGPSNLRDTFSLYPDSYVHPYYYQADRPYNLVKTNEETIAISAFDHLNEESMRVGVYEDVKKDAIDLYPFLKYIYEQNREKLIQE